MRVTARFIHFPRISLAQARREGLLPWVSRGDFFFCKAILCIHSLPISLPISPSLSPHTHIPLSLSFILSRIFLVSQPIQDPRDQRCRRRHFEPFKLGPKSRRYASILAFMCVLISTGICSSALCAHIHRQHSAHSALGIARQRCSRGTRARCNDPPWRRHRSLA